MTESLRHCEPLGWSIHRCDGTEWVFLPVDCFVALLLAMTRGDRFAAGNDWDAALAMIVRPPSLRNL